MKQNPLFKKLHLKFTCTGILFSAIFVIPIILFYNMYLAFLNEQRSADFIEIMKNELEYKYSFSDEDFSDAYSEDVSGWELRRKLSHPKIEKNYRKSIPLFFNFIAMNVSLPGDRNVMTFLFTDDGIEFDRQFEDLDLNNDELYELQKKALDSRNTITKENVYMFSSRTIKKGVVGVVLERSNELYQERRFLVVSIFIFLLCGIFSFIISWVFTWKMLKPAVNAFEKQKRFIADASHELKTPLAIMSANIDVLMNELKGNKWLEYIKVENERMSALVKDLFFLVKSDTGQLTVDFKKVDLAEEVNFAVLPFESFCFETKKSLNIILPSEKIYVKGEAARLQQCAVILTDNAIKNSNTGDTITVTVAKEGGFGYVKVTNTGSGIKKEDMPYLFDRFFRSDSSRTRITGGYGLGLPIAKSIVDLHHGKIEVHSIENDHTDFTFYIPLAT